MKKTAILLINVGTPDKPELKHVRQYLSEFLNDKYVIDLPWFFRKLLVNGIIVPFRAPKSTRFYEKLWTEKGSPLLYHLNSLTEKLRQKMPDNYLVISAMRYGNPSVKSALEQIKEEHIDQLIAIPLYPQYAASTTESAKQHVFKQLKKSGINTDIRFIEQFYNHPSFIRAFSEKISSYRPEDFDHVVFSYHGLPISHVQKTHPEQPFNACKCADKMPRHGAFCYKASCNETSRLLAERLAIPKENYTTAFQSRLSKNWIQPFTDDVLSALAAQGSKSVLMVAPSFVADCLETTYEIGVEYKKKFLACGGKELIWVESLNDSDSWVEALMKIIS